MKWMRVGREHEVDARVRHEVGLELGDVHVERTVEAERRGERGDHLAGETVQVRVRRALDVQVTTADIVQGLIIDLVSDVRMFQKRVHAQHRVVRLDARRGDLRARPDGEGNLALLAVVDGEALEEQAAETGASAAAAVKDHEALETGAVVRELAQAVQHEVHDLLTDGVVAAGEVVGGILLTGDKLLRVEELAVGTRADLIDHGRLQIDEHRARDVLASAGLREERVERIVTATDRLVRRHLAIRLDTVLEAEQLPARVPNLRARLAHVDEDSLTHGVWLSATSRKLERRRAKRFLQRGPRGKKLEPKWLRFPICAP